MDRTATPGQGLPHDIILSAEGGNRRALVKTRFQIPKLATALRVAGADPDDGFAVSQIRHGCADLGIVEDAELAAVLIVKAERGPQPTLIAQLLARDFLGSGGSSNDAEESESSVSSGRRQQIVITSPYTLTAMPSSGLLRP